MTHVCATGPNMAGSMPTLGAWVLFLWWIDLYNNSMIGKWRFPKMGIPQVTLGFNTESWSNDLGMIWGSILGNPPIMGISEEYSGDDIVASPKTKKCFQNGNDRIYPIFSGLPSFLSIYLSIYRSIYLSFYLSIYLSIYIYMYIYICMYAPVWNR